MSARDYIRMETMYREYRKRMNQEKQREIYLLKTSEGLLLVQEGEGEEQS